MFTLSTEFACVHGGSRACRAKAEDQAWVEVSQFYNSYRENSESVLKRKPLLSAKSKGKQRATDAETWSTMGRELPLQFQGQKGVDVALRLIEEASTSAGSSTTVKERVAVIESKVRLIRFSALYTFVSQVSRVAGRTQPVVSVGTARHTQD